MDIRQIVEDLRAERSRFDEAIAALEGTTPRRGFGARRRRRTMSSEARAKIAAAQRARWAIQKSGAAPKKAKAATKSASKKPPARKGMSAAARKKLSAMMKARWASRKSTARKK